MQIQFESPPFGGGISELCVSKMQLSGYDHHVGFSGLDFTKARIKLIPIADSRSNDASVSHPVEAGWMKSEEDSVV